MTDKNVVEREFYLDWLRVIAIMAVFVFHCTRFFDQLDWHVKNQTTYQGVQMWTMFQANWGMPLIFLVSGASVFFSVTKIGKFVKNKVLRLLVPLVVGVFTHVAIAVYLDRLTHHLFYGSFFQFYPKYFQGIYGSGGNFAWMGLHLWYLLVLFVFSLVFLPLFYLLKGPWKPALTWLGNFFATPGVFYLLALPIILLSMKIDPGSPLGGRGYGGWSLLCYIPFFLYGFLLIANPRLQAVIKQWRWISFAFALICTASLFYLFLRSGNGFYGSRQYNLVSGFFGLNGWLWVLTVMGFGMKHLNFPTKFLYYANQAVLPFYILHQTVILIVGYYVTRWEIPDLAKFVIILVSSFILVMALYEFVIRRVNFLRILFGMKANPKIQPARSKTPGPVSLKPY